MSDNLMIIKTKRLSPREVKKKLRDFIDEISEDCGPEVEQMADDLKAHGDEFIDALSGNGNYRGGSYRDGGGNYRNDGGGNYRDGGAGGGGGHYRSGGHAWNRDGSPEDREENRRKNERKLQELERQMQEMRQQIMQDM